MSWIFHNQRYSFSSKLIYKDKKTLTAEVLTKDYLLNKGWFPLVTVIIRRIQVSSGTLIPLTLYDSIAYSQMKTALSESQAEAEEYTDHKA